MSRPLAWGIRLLTTASVACAMASHGAGIEKPRGPVRIPDRYRAQLLRADSLFQVQRTEQAHAILAALIADSRLRGDSAARLFLLRTQGDMWMRLGRGLEAEAPLSEADRLAGALEDSASLCRVSWLRANVASMLGCGAEATTLYRRALALALALGDRGNEGRARTGLAFAAMNAGHAREAIEEYRHAADLLHEAGDWRSELNALIGLGRAHTQVGEYDRARACNLRVAEVAEKGGDWWSQGHALNNLGTLDYSLGDPGAAMSRFQRSYELFTSHRNLAESITPAHNIALCDRDLGRYDDAAAILSAALDSCEAGALREHRSQLFARLAEVRIHQERPHEAVTLARRAVAACVPQAIEARQGARLSLAHALVAVDSGPAALAVLETPDPPAGQGTNPALRLATEGYRSQLLFDARRFADARACALDVEREAARLGIEGYRVEALTTAARCERALGHPERALVLLTRACEVWEVERRVPLDPEWRETRGSSTRRLARTLADVSLEFPPDLPVEARIRLAFDRVQGFQARTLAERMRGPGADSLPYDSEARGLTMTVARLQREILRDDEILLEAFVDADTSLLFAVTRTRCRVNRIPGERVLAPRVRLLRQLLADPAGQGGEAIAGAASGLGRQVLGGCAGLLGQHRRILFVPDGSLALVPLGVLSLQAVGARSTPILVDHEILIYPSADLIPRLRGRSAGRARSPVRVLALAAGTSSDRVALRGAEAEVRGLGRRFRNVDVRVDESGGGPAPAPPDLTVYDALHFAAHTAVDDQHPWRSAIQLADADRGADAWLRASRIAGQRLPARLAVLSGCESAGGRRLSGEGVLGLTAAFMSAGVPAVVATLWPVDDHATADLMRRFYDGLALGRTAGGALRDAQLTLRGERRTSAPFFWAGFVLLGDGDVRLPLERRAAWARPGGAPP